MKTLLIIITLSLFAKTSNAIYTTNASIFPVENSFTTIANYEIKTPSGATFTLRAGTPIVVEVAQTTNAKNLSEGQTISIRVKYNVVVNKQTLVAAGALGTATITDINKPGVFGKAGRMELQVQSVQAVDGQQILLSGIPMVAEGQHKKGLAWGLSVPLFLLTIIGGGVGLFIKGKPAEIKAGTTTNTTVASDAQIQMNDQ